MDNISVWLAIIVISIVFGIFSRIGAYRIKLNKEKVSKINRFKFEKGSTFWFFEIWRDFVNYFVTGTIVYFLIAIRWPYIIESGILSVGDYILCLAFFIGILGWWPYFIKNITEGINVIIERFLRK